jgi:hypothetical protein
VIEGLGTDRLRLGEQEDDPPVQPGADVLSEGSEGATAVFTMGRRSQQVSPVVGRTKP